MKNKIFRKCRLLSCQKEFETNRDWQHFCCAEHRIAYWKQTRKDQRQFNEIIADHEKRIQYLEKNILK